MFVGYRRDVENIGAVSKDKSINGIINDTITNLKHMLAYADQIGSLTPEQLGQLFLGSLQIIKGAINSDDAYVKKCESTRTAIFIVFYAYASANQQR